MLGAFTSFGAARVGKLTLRHVTNMMDRENFMVFTSFVDKPANTFLIISV